jgi:gluconolactonase
MTRLWIIIVVACLASTPAVSQSTSQARRPDAVVNLATDEGAQVVCGQWLYHDVAIIPAENREPGADLKPSGAPNRTYDIAPHAGAKVVDESTWESIGATTLEQRRTPGKLSFGWYRINLTLPERVGSLEVRGSTVLFEVVVDDYAEVWVDGRLPLVLGEAGAQVVGGWNAPNRVVLTVDAKPGEQVQLALFAINGPLSDPPSNFVWIRSATLEFFAAGSNPIEEVPVAVDRLDPARLATGFEFLEGPVWVRDGGYLLFSDPNANVIYRWTPNGGSSVFRTKSGYAGVDIGEYKQPGSNGLTLDREGRLVINEHGNRRVTRLEKNGVITVLADRYEGKRLNSPNDLAYRSDGSLYFTDPPFGLPKVFEDQRKELPYSGIFLLRDGTLQLLNRDLQGPNGLAFSPDEQFLYVGNWDVQRKVVMRYRVQSDGTLSKGEVFFDMTDAPGEEALDGLKVDTAGNLFVSGPGGVWILSPDGRHLGTIRAPELPANFAWGDEDGRTLYMTARTGLYRMRLRIPGIRP